MNARDLFRRIMHFESVDRIPLWDLEGITREAERLWCMQGFPIGWDVNEYIGFDDSLNRRAIPLDTNPIPSFVPRTLAEDERWKTTVDPYGFTVKTAKDHSVGPRTYIYLAGSVNGREDWESMKKRYDPRDVRRYPKSWGEELVEWYQTASSTVSVWIPGGPGRYIKNGYMMGLERFLEVIFDDPGLVQDMFSFWADFVIELFDGALAEIPADLAFIMEDGLAYKTSSLVSPQMYREFWFPHVRRVIDFLRGHGIDIIGFYTSGNIKPLIPVLLDVGFNLFAPLEVAADMDAIELREEYGRDVLLMGNIARQALMDGKEAVEEEVRSKVPRLMELGGYIPAVDDMILPDISFDSFMHYVDLIRGIEL